MPDTCLSDFTVMMLCTAYESGVGKGLETVPPLNPYKIATLEYRAYSLGVEQGAKMRKEMGINTPAMMKALILRVHEIAMRPIPGNMNIADACQRDLAEIIALTEEVALSE